MTTFLHLLIALFCSLARPIRAEGEAKTLLFPASANNTKEDLAGNANFLDDSALLRGSVQQESTNVPLLPANYYLPPTLQRPIVHHRSEGLPYILDFPNAPAPTNYAIAPVSVEQSVAPTSKQLVIVSFIGLLLLFAIIQNTIAASKRKDASLDIASRRRRDAPVGGEFSDRLAGDAFESVLNEDARVRCIQRTICVENRKLLDDFGATIAKILADYLTRNVAKSVKSSAGWDRLIRDAGAAGLRGEDCQVLYRDCDSPASNVPLLREEGNGGSKR